MTVDDAGNSRSMSIRCPSSLGVFLATDLGSRCDCAQERATMLARHSTIVPVAATVVDASALPSDSMIAECPSWYRPLAPVDRVAGRLRRDLEPTGLRWRICTEQGGNVGNALSDIADRELPEGAHQLIVTGPVRNVTASNILGSSVDRLLQRPGSSLLMVRRRALRSYRHLLVASDFSASAVRAMSVARTAFPRAQITIIHGFDIPLLGLMDGARLEVIARTKTRLLAEAGKFLRECGMIAAEVNVIVEHGEPARLVRMYAEVFSPDLIVVGTHGRSAVYDIVIGSVAKRIVARCDTDVLMVGRGVPFGQ